MESLLYHIPRWRFWARVYHILKCVLSVHLTQLALILFPAYWWDKLLLNVSFLWPRCASLILRVLQKFHHLRLGPISGWQGHHEHRPPQTSQLKLASRWSVCFPPNVCQQCDDSRLVPRAKKPSIVAPIGSWRISSFIKKIIKELINVNQNRLYWLNYTVQMPTFYIYISFCLFERKSRNLKILSGTVIKLL